MWTEEDFQDAIDLIGYADYQEEITELKKLLNKTCIGEDKIKLWGRMPEMLKEILKHPEYLPSETEHDLGAAA